VCRPAQSCGVNQWHRISCLEATARTPFNQLKTALEHRYPAEYGKKIKVQGDADHPLPVLHTLPQEQLEAKIQQLLAQLGYGGTPAPETPEAS